MRTYILNLSQKAGLLTFMWTVKLYIYGYPNLSKIMNKVNDIQMYIDVMLRSSDNSNNF